MSLSPSPRRLKPSEIRRIVRPGKMMSHGAVKKYWLPRLARFPSSGRRGLGLSPMKVSAETVRMTLPISRVACTMSG